MIIISGLLGWGGHSHEAIMYLFPCLNAFLQNRKKVASCSVGLTVSSGWLNTTNIVPVWYCSWPNSCSAYLPVLSSFTWCTATKSLSRREKKHQCLPPGWSQHSSLKRVILCLPSVRGNYIPLAQGVKSLSVLGWQGVTKRLEGMQHKLCCCYFLFEKRVALVTL